MSEYDNLHSLPRDIDLETPDQLARKHLSELDATTRAITEAFIEVARGMAKEQPLMREAVEAAIIEVQESRDRNIRNTVREIENAIGKPFLPSEN